MDISTDVEKQISGGGIVKMIQLQQKKKKRKSLAVIQKVNGRIIT